MFTYAAGGLAAYENQTLMKPIKMTRLAEIFKLLIYLLQLFMMDFYSLECGEVYKNTTLVFSVAFSVYFNLKIYKFCFIMTFAKKAHIFN